jgi:hypothetical protein
MSTKTNKPRHEIIERLVGEARKTAEQDRRASERHPFFKPVAIHLDGRCYSAFSRDISVSAIGLLHHMSLPAREVEISIPIDATRATKLRIRVGACEPCGAGWFISYGEFVATSDARD